MVPYLRVGDARHFHKKDKGTNLVEVENEVVAAQRRSHVYDDSFETLQYLNLITRMKKGRALLGDIFLRQTAADAAAASASRGPAHTGKRTILAYSAPTTLDHSEGKNAMYFKNFHYFLDHAIDCRVHSTVIVTTKVVIDAYRLWVMQINHEQCRDSPYSVELLERENKCYDMESMRRFLQDTDTSQWDHFLYINCGMVGPKWEGEGHWTDIFTSKLSDMVKLTGLTINMSFYPHVQSFTLAADRVGIDIIKNSDAVYDCGVYNGQSMTEEQRW